MDFDDLDVVDADDGAAATSDINIQDEGGEAGDVSIDSHEVVVVVNKKQRWGRPEAVDLATAPSSVVDDLETIDEWRQSLMADKDLWANGWHMLEAGPAKTAWWVDKYGIYMQKGGASINEETKDEYYWHCIASERCRRKLMQVSKKIKEIDNEAKDVELIVIFPPFFDRLHSIKIMIVFRSVPRRKIPHSSMVTTVLSIIARDMD